MDESINELIGMVMTITLTTVMIMLIIGFGIYSRDFISNRYDRQSEKYATYHYEKAIKYDNTTFTTDNIIQFIQSNIHEFNIEVHIDSSNIYKATIGDQNEWSVYRWQEVFKYYGHEEFLCEVIDISGTVEKVLFILY